MFGGVTSTHLGILLFCDHAPFLVPPQFLNDGPLISKPSSHVTVQFAPYGDFCSVQSSDSYDPKGIFGSGGQRISEMKIAQLRGLVLFKSTLTFA